MRILYVEDNATNVILVQRVANMGKHEVVHCDQGQAALDRFTQIKPDLILLDVQLRGALTGLDVARILREKGCLLPILAVTAYAMKGDRQRCLDAGCDDYLPKPISVAELVTIFKRYGDAVASGKPIFSMFKPPFVAVMSTANSSTLQSVAEAATVHLSSSQPVVEGSSESVIMPVETAPSSTASPAVAPITNIVGESVLPPEISGLDSPSLYTERESEGKVFDSPTTPSAEPAAHQTPTPVTAES